MHIHYRLELGFVGGTASGVPNSDRLALSVLIMLTLTLSRGSITSLNATSWPLTATSWSNPHNHINCCGNNWLLETHHNIKEKKEWTLSSKIDGFTAYLPAKRIEELVTIGIVQNSGISFGSVCTMEWVPKKPLSNFVWAEMGAARVYCSAPSPCINYCPAARGKPVLEQQILISKGGPKHHCVNWVANQVSCNPNQQGDLDGMNLVNPHPDGLSE